jgi:hypothetical protein
MKALQIIEPYRFAIIDIEHPKPSADEVVIKLEYAAICNQNDYKIFYGLYGDLIKYPFALVSRNPASSLDVARWQTASIPQSASITVSLLHIEPETVSTPGTFTGVLNCNARTLYPSRTSAGRRFRPILPLPPVTRMLLISISTTAAVF